MAVNPQRLGVANPAGTTLSTIYTVPVGKSAIVKQFTVCNDTAAAATINVKLAGVPLVSLRTLTARETIIIDLSQVLNAGESIEVQAGTANSIYVMASGIEVA